MQYIYTTGLNAAVSDRQLILLDPVTGLLAVIKCGSRLTGKNLYSMCRLQAAVKRTRGATWYCLSMENVAHTDGTLINRIHKKRYDSRINRLTSMFHVRHSFKARYWKSQEEALDRTVRKTRCGRRRGLLSPTRLHDYCTATDAENCQWVGPLLRESRHTGE